MSDLKKKFDAAAADSKNLSEALGNDVKLRIYGLFKQAGAGDVTGHHESGRETRSREWRRGGKELT
jgi:acyl-CoA-binding protein